MGFFKRLFQPQNPARDNRPQKGLERPVQDIQGAAARGFGSAYPPIELGYYHEALIIARHQGNKHREWEALENIGDCLRSIESHEEAAAFYSQALEVARKIDETHKVGSLLSLSDVYEKMGKKARGEQYHQEAITIALKSKGAVLSKLGVHLAAAGEEEYLKRAVRLFELHLQLAQKTGSRDSEEGALINLGSAYQNLGYVHRAIDYFKKALVIAREINDTDGEQGALGSLGSAYKSVGDLRKAAEHLDHALVLGRESGNESRFAINALNMARLLVQQGDLKRALPLAQEAADTFERIGDPNTPRAKEMVARILSAGK